MAQDLPEHMIFLILLWLPVKSLLRFKAVCKYWYALIQSSTFINQHLHHQQHNVNSSLIVRKCLIEKSGYSNHKSRFFMLTDHKFDEASICLDFANEEMKRYKINSPVLISELCVSNTCNGIICLHFWRGGFDIVALWNPAIKQLRPLPLVQFSPSRPPQQNIRTYPLLGFDIKTNDYKVLNIIESDDPYREFDNISQVEIYNLSTDAWRILHTDYPLPFYTTCSIKVAYKNGICFWTGTPSIQSEQEVDWVLISFDFSTETFRFMPMPNISKWLQTYALDFLDENLICINDPLTEFIPNEYYNLNNHQHFDIWVLHGYGTKESWTKLYTIGPFDSLKPHKFLKAREFLVMSTKSRICVYNLVTQEIVTQERPDLCGRRPVSVIYNESLVSIKGENGASNRETSLRQFARICEDEVDNEEEEDSKEEGEEEDDEMDEKRVESQSEEESEEDREIKDLESKI